MKWDTGKTYSQSDMLRMQQDAIRRVRDMQARADRTLQNANSEHINHSTTYSPPPPVPVVVPVSTTTGTPTPNNLGGGNMGVHNAHVGGGGFESLLNNGSNILGSVLSYFTGSKTEDEELSPIATILEALHLDKERLIVLGLLVVLMNEKADKTMLLALFYLLF